MNKINPKDGNTLRYELNDGTIVGQFYNSYDRLNHLAIFIPSKQLPREFLCGALKSFENWCGSTDDRPEKKCKTCFAKMRVMDKKK